MEGPGVLPVQNETVAQSSRKNKEGTTITYKLNVIQQPIRARACGSGAKSSTDRRPVDPPPIIELRIFEGEGSNESDLKDITFSMNATYFICVTLEQARNLAHGRSGQDHKAPPVLAGTNMAGTNYLDRPSPAGYFIFSDLSVRHEGRYRLVFTLFENTKDSKDEDPEEENVKPLGDFTCHRAEVRSLPFQVYSAKKFPGLAESTPLSRTVAEQGCRVRIRRDVRMRRRSDKHSKDWDGYEDDTADARAKTSATPDPSGYHTLPYMEPVARPRSSSNASLHSLAPSVSRRTSSDVMPALTASSYGTAPHTPQSTYVQSSPYPGGLVAHPAFAHQPPMQPPPPAYQPVPATQPALPAPSSQQPVYGYGPPPPTNLPSGQIAPPPPSYENAPYSQRPGIDYTSPGGPSARRPSGIYTAVTQSPQTYPSYNQGPTYPPPFPASHSHHSSFGSMDGYSRPSPAEPVQPPTRTSGVLTPLSSHPFNDKKLPPLTTTYNTTSSNAGLRYLEPSSPASSSQPQTSYFPRSATTTTTTTDSNKRAYNQVFNDRHLSGPLRQGARPSSMYAGGGVTMPSVPGLYTAVDDDSVQDLDADLADSAVKMIYRRADGRQVNRNLPSHD